MSISSHTYWKTIDNSKIKIAKQLKIKGSITRRPQQNKNTNRGATRKLVRPGDILVVFPRKFTYVNKKVERQKYLGLVAGMKKKVRRRGGHFITGPINAVIIISQQGKMVGSRVFGPVYREVRRRRNSYIYKKIFARTSYFV